MADLEKAKKQATDEAITFAWVIFFTVMRDKEGYGTRVRLPRLWRRVQYLIDSVRTGKVKIHELREELKQAGIEIE